MTSYRFFVSYPTDEDGKPAIDGNDPSYFRAPDGGGVALPTSQRVEFWDGKEWKNSSLQPLMRHLDDVLAGGATVREILDVRELPRA